MITRLMMLGGAKRVAVARYFKDAGVDALYSYELTARVPIALVADVIVGRKWNDPQVCEDIYEQMMRIDAEARWIVVPFVDGAVSVAAEVAQRWPEQVFAPTSTPELSELMFDKVRANAEFERVGLPVPRYVDGAEVPFPLIAKPRHGSASQGLVNIDCAEDLRRIGDPAEYLLQERIDHRDEYTVDCYISRSGDVLACVPRKRIEVAGGEVMRTATVFAPELVDLASEAVTKLGLQGAVTVQIIHDLDTDRRMIMEINPRLGGGVVCAIAAEANIPALIVAEARGEQPQMACYRPYTEVARYLQDVIFRG